MSEVFYLFNLKYVTVGDISKGKNNNPSKKQKYSLFEMPNGKICVYSVGINLSFLNILNCLCTINTDIIPPTNSGGGIIWVFIQTT